MMEAKRAAETAGMSRGQWLQARRRGIGGSDAPALMGASPWATPLSVYADKMGFLPEKEETVAMRFGRDAEEIVARWFAQDTGKKVRRLNAILQHSRYPWMLANIDRKIQGESAGLECKTTSAFHKTDFEAGKIPPYYYWQCVHYLAVTNLERWYLAVICGNSGFYHYVIARNEEHIRILTEREKDFWINHVQAGVPPEPSGQEADGIAIGAMNALSESPECTSAELEGLEEVFDQLALAKAARNASEKQIAVLEQQIKMRMANAQRGRCGRWRVSYCEQIRTTLDGKRLKAELPQVYEAYKKANTSRPLLVREAEREEGD